MPVIYVYTIPPSNKPHSGENKIRVKFSDIAYGSKISECIVLIPKIDKLSLTYSGIPPSEYEAVLAQFFSWESDKELLKNAGNFGKQNYKNRFELTYPGNGEKILIELNPKKSSTSFMRLEFNPAKLGLEGMEFLRLRIESILCNNYPWQDIAAKGRVTRIDIAVDIIGTYADIDSLQAMEAPQATKAIPGKKWGFYASSGETETIYLGVKGKGKLAPIILYNKAQQLTDTNSPPMYGNCPHIRVEVRKTPQCSITSLLSMKNPLLDVSIIDSFQPVTPPETPHAWRFFLDCCHLRGKEHALSLLPSEELREAYAKALKTAEHKLWRPEKLWEKWSIVMERSGLLP